MATRTGSGHAVLNSFRSIVKGLRLADRAGLKEHGLGASQLYVLHELRRDSPLSINDLAERMATDQSTVSVVVAKLIAKGYVTSERSETDARRVDLTLTAKGQLLVKKLPPPIQQIIVDAVDQMPKSRAQALAEALRELCGIIGFGDETPPMLFSDEDPPKSRRKTMTKKKRGARG